MWSALFLTLPTQPNAIRLRTWRALKALGCGALRDGVYLLPESQSALFEPIVTEVREHGGQAHVLELSARNEAERSEVLALFDRAEAYGEWHREVQAFAAALPSLNEAQARQRWRAVAEGLQAVQRIDYYPGAAADQARAELSTLREAVEARFSPGEPRAQAPHGIAHLDPRKFKGRRWATRARPWVDRLASAWLIRRFIDPQASFVWLTDPANSTPPPRHALGFDYDGARFTHVGPLVTFEVLATSFALDADPRLQRIARIVRFLDSGGIPVAEAAGLEAVLSGLREVHDNDDQLVQAAAAVFDALYATKGTTT
jgi:hypothetical protein